MIILEILPVGAWSLLLGLPPLTDLETDSLHLLNSSNSAGLGSRALLR